MLWLLHIIKGRCPLPIKQSVGGACDSGGVIRVKSAGPVSISVYCDCNSRTAVQQRGSDCWRSVLNPDLEEPAPSTALSPAWVMELGSPSEVFSPPHPPGPIPDPRCDQKVKGELCLNPVVAQLVVSTVSVPPHTHSRQVNVHQLPQQLHHVRSWRKCFHDDRRCSCVVP